MDFFEITATLSLAVAGVIEVFKPAINQIFPNKTPMRTLSIRLLVFVVAAILIASDPGLIETDPILSLLNYNLAIVVGAGSVAIGSAFVNYGLQAAGSGKRYVEAVTKNKQNEPEAIDDKGDASPYGRAKINNKDL